MAKRGSIMRHALSAIFRPISIALLGTWASTSGAQARVGPEIAYSINNQIFLINSDGSANVRIHRASGNAFIDSISLRKGGGQIAFIENWVLKFMSFDNAGARVGPVYSLPGCYRQFDVQFAPDGQSVIYGELCDNVSAIRRVAVPTPTNPRPSPETLVPGIQYLDVGSFDGIGQSFVYSFETPTGYQMRRHYLDGRTDNDVAVLSTPLGSMIRHSALSHDGTKVLFADWGGSYTTASTGYIEEYDIASDEHRTNLQRATIGDYGPVDDKILYAEKQGKTTYLRYRDATGLPRNVTKSTAWEAFHDIDWGD